MRGEEGQGQVQQYEKKAAESGFVFIANKREKQRERQTALSRLKRLIKGEKERESYDCDILDNDEVVLVVVGHGDDLQTKKTTQTKPKAVVTYTCCFRVTKGRGWHYTPNRHRR
jgi:hypothetical protein